MPDRVFFRKYFQIVDKVAHYETRWCTCEAEDLRQIVLEKISDCTSLFKNIPERALYSYLRISVRNMHQDVHRTCKIKCLQLDSTKDIDWHASLTAYQETLLDYKRIFDTLPPQDRKILEASCLHRYTNKRRATYLGLKLNTYHQQQTENPEI